MMRLNLDIVFVSAIAFLLGMIIQGGDWSVWTLTVFALGVVTLTIRATSPGDAPEDSEE